MGTTTSAYHARSHPMGSLWRVEEEICIRCRGGTVMKSCNMVGHHMEILVLLNSTNGDAAAAVAEEQVEKDGCGHSSLIRLVGIQNGPRQGWPRMRVVDPCWGHGCRRTFLGHDESSRTRPQSQHPPPHAGRLARQHIVPVGSFDGDPVVQAPPPLRSAPGTERHYPPRCSRTNPLEQC